MKQPSSAIVLCTMLAVGTAACAAHRVRHIPELQIGHRFPELLVLDGVNIAFCRPGKLWTRSCSANHLVLPVGWNAYRAGCHDYDCRGSIELPDGHLISWQGSRDSASVYNGTIAEKYSRLPSGAEQLEVAIPGVTNLSAMIHDASDIEWTLEFARSVVSAPHPCRDCVSPAGRPSLEHLLEELTVADWGRVWRAKLALENLQGGTIEALLTLMRDQRRIPLTNAGGLLYPGSRVFYGHGLVMPYDFDSIAVRAGWVLEDLSFQDFGVAERGWPVPGPVPRDQIERAADAATKWWSANAVGWTRLGALQQALESERLWRQVAALNYLREGTTICNDLNRVSYAERILPIVRHLAEAGDDGPGPTAQLVLRNGWRR